MNTEQRKGGIIAKKFAVIRICPDEEYSEIFGIYDNFYHASSRAKYISENYPDAVAVFELVSAYQSIVTPLFVGKPEPLG